MCINDNKIWRLSPFDRKGDFSEDVFYTLKATEGKTAQLGLKHLVKSSIVGHSMFFLMSFGKILENLKVIWTTI